MGNERPRTDRSSTFTIEFGLRDSTRILSLAELHARIGARERIRMLVERELAKYDEEYVITA